MTVYEFIKLSNDYALHSNHETQLLETERTVFIMTQTVLNTVWLNLALFCFYLPNSNVDSINKGRASLKKYLNIVQNDCE